MQIIRTDAELQTPRVDQALRDAGHELLLMPDGVSQTELIAQAKSADLILMCYTPITREVIESSQRLRGIVKYGVGIDAIGMLAAREYDVVVVNIPEYAEETVAEGAFALLISLAKKLLQLCRQMETNGWAWPEPQWIANDIAGKTLGIVGLGKIGRSMARMAGAGFRANVVAFDPYVTVDAMASAGVTKFDRLSHMLPLCDFLSIHCVLTPETRHLIDEAALRSMKASSVLVNTSRGEIIDESALLHALNERWIAGAGLDVFTQ